MSVFITLFVGTYGGTIGKFSYFIPVYVCVCVCVCVNVNGEAPVCHAIEKSSCDGGKP